MIISIPNNVYNAMLICLKVVLSSEIKLISTGVKIAVKDISSSKTVFHITINKLPGRKGYIKKLDHSYT